MRRPAGVLRLLAVAGVLGAVVGSGLVASAGANSVRPVRPSSPSCPSAHAPVAKPKAAPKTGYAVVRSTAKATTTMMAKGAKKPAAPPGRRAAGSARPSSRPARATSRCASGTAQGVQSSGRAPARNPAAHPVDPAVSGFVSRSGAGLVLAGRPFRFTGVNMYQGLSDFPVNIGCGTTINDLDSAFAALRPGSVVRVWATQFQAINRNTWTLDWAPFDRFINAATRHQVRLVMTLGEQAGVCDDGHWKDQDWYRGGYHQAFDDAHRGASPYSYWDWLHLVVPRYDTNPTIAFWEPLNEPQTANCNPGFQGEGCYGHGYCPDGNAELLRDWLTTIGGEIHRLAPSQLVSSGTIGTGECGAWRQYYAMMASSPGVDVLTVHDYDPSPLNPTMAQHIDQARDAGKPIVWEEVGTDATPPGGNGCAKNVSDRADLFTTKIRTLFAHPEVAGFLAWNWIEQRGNGCDLEIGPHDPLITTLNTALG